jgi:hypothetical protein
MSCNACTSFWDLYQYYIIEEKIQQQASNKPLNMGQGSYPFEYYLTTKYPDVAAFTKTSGIFVTLTCPGKEKDDYYKTDLAVIEPKTRRINDQGHEVVDGNIIATINDINDANWTCKCIHCFSRRTYLSKYNHRLLYIGLSEGLYVQTSTNSGPITLECCDLALLVLGSYEHLSNELELIK